MNLAATCKNSWRLPAGVVDVHQSLSVVHGRHDEALREGIENCPELDLTAQRVASGQEVHEELVERGMRHAVDGACKWMHGERLTIPCDDDRAAGVEAHADFGRLRLVVRDSVDHELEESHGEGPVRFLRADVQGRSEPDRLQALEHRDAVGGRI